MVLPSVGAVALPSVGSAGHAAGAKEELCCRMPAFKIPSDVLPLHIAATLQKATTDGLRLHCMSLRGEVLLSVSLCVLWIRSHLVVPRPSLTVSADAFGVYDEFQLGGCRTELAI